MRRGNPRNAVGRSWANKFLDAPRFTSKICFWKHFEFKTADLPPDLATNWRSFGRVAQGVMLRRLVSRMSAISIDAYLVVVG